MPLLIGSAQTTFHLTSISLHLTVQTSRYLSHAQVAGEGYLPAPTLPDQPGAPRTSWEGGPQRCFRHMYVCTQGANRTATWPLHAFGQHLVSLHLADLPADAQALVRAQPPLALQRRLRLAAEGAAGNSRKAGPRSSRQAKPAVLNVLFHQRSGDRMPLNVAELLKRCNAWRFTTSAGVEVRARCSEVGIRAVVFAFA